MSGKIYKKTHPKLVWPGIEKMIEEVYKNSPKMDKIDLSYHKYVPWYKKLFKWGKK